MSENEKTVDEQIDEAFAQEDHDDTIELPNSLGPNFHIQLAPNGYLRMMLGFDVMHVTGYCDAQWARTVADMLVQAAEYQEKVEDEIRTREALSQASNVIDFDAVQRAAGIHAGTPDSDVNEDPADDLDTPVEEVADFEEAVEDAVVADVEGFD